MFENESRNTEQSNILNDEEKENIQPNNEEDQAHQNNSKLEGENSIYTNTSKLEGENSTYTNTSKLEGENSIYTNTSKQESKDHIYKNILNNENIIQKIIETSPTDIDETDVESRIKYFDKIEKTINFIDSQIGDEYLKKKLEEKKQQLDKSNFQKGICEKEFKNAFEDLYPDLIKELDNERSKKDGLEDVKSIAISEEEMISALDKIEKTLNK